MRQLRYIVIPAVFASALISPASARMQYHTAFKKTYEKSRPKLVEKKCAVCHEGATKKVRTDYGKGFEKALGGTNVKDEKKIEAALKEVEEQLPSED